MLADPVDPILTDCRQLRTLLILLKPILPEHGFQVVISDTGDFVPLELNAELVPHLKVLGKLLPEHL